MIFLMRYHLSVGRRSRAKRYCIVCIHEGGREGDSYVYFENTW